MNASQLLGAVAEYASLKKELAPVGDGFGVEGLKITVKLRSGEQWDLADLSVVVEEGLVARARGVGRHESEKGAPTRWFSVHFDHADIAWVEFETFAG